MNLELGANENQGPENCDRSDFFDTAWLSFDTDLDMIFNSTTTERSPPAECVRSETTQGPPLTENVPKRQRTQPLPTIPVLSQTPDQSTSQSNLVSQSSSYQPRLGPSKELEPPNEPELTTLLPHSSIRPKERCQSKAEERFLPATPNSIAGIKKSPLALRVSKGQRAHSLLAIPVSPTPDRLTSQSPLITQSSLDQHTLGPPEEPEPPQEPDSTLFPPPFPIKSVESFESKAEERCWTEATDSISTDPIHILLNLSTDFINQPSDVVANNYLNKIQFLLNTTTCSNLKVKNGKTIRYEYPSAFQCIGPDGKIWEHSELQEYLRDERNLFIRRFSVVDPSNKTTKKHEFAYCLLSGCHCGFAPHEKPGRTKTIINNIMQHLPILFYCNLCSRDNNSAFNSKVGVRNHFPRCPFVARAAAEDKTIEVTNTDWISIRATIPVVYRPIHDEDFNSRLVRFLERLYQLGQQRGLFSPSTFATLLPTMQKSPMLPVIVQVFSDYERLHPPASKFEVDMKRDTFFIIQYQVPGLMYDHRSKIFKFQIVERKRQKAISVWRMEGATELPKDKKCNYPACPCGNEFTTYDADAFAGHILQLNFLVVCYKCSVGFTLWYDFENHLSEDCLTERIMNLYRATKS